MSRPAFGPETSVPWPEEFNRRWLVSPSALHFAPTPRARDNLLREGVPADRIVVVGNTVVDALLYYAKRMGKDYTPIDQEVAALPLDKKLVLATLHRRENIGEPFRNVLQRAADPRQGRRQADRAAGSFESAGPRRGLRASCPTYRMCGSSSRLQYTDFVYLLNRAWVVVSDSGGVQEEAPTFGVQILISPRDHRASRGHRGRFRHARRVRLPGDRHRRAKADRGRPSPPAAREQSVRAR